MKGEDVLEGAADGFMQGAITGGIQGAASFAKASKMMGSLDDAARFNKTANTTKACPKDCFVAGTLIKTEKGYKAIEEIEVGDKVWAWDEETGEQALKTVVQLFRNEKDVLVHIEVAGEQIQTTLGHPFYVANKGWVKAGELKAGDVLKLYDGKEVEIDSISIKDSKPVLTYNFEVEDSHTYYVTQNDVLVHNACHGNSLKTTKPTDLYVLRDRNTGLIKKIGQTTRGSKRYSNKFYNKKNVTMDIIDSGSKVEMRKAETDLLKTLRDYFPDDFKRLWNKGIH